MSQWNTTIKLAALSLVAASVSSALAADNARYIVKYKNAQGSAAFSPMDISEPSFTGNGSAVSIQRRAANLENLGAKVRKTVNHNTLAAELAPWQKLQLQQDPNVEYVEEDSKRFLMAQEIPYGYLMVQADQVSDQFAGNQKICIIDSGLELPHEDHLASNITGSNDSGTGNWDDQGGPHGTHVAGTIAAINNGSGVVGVLPNGNVKLHIVKVFNEAGWGYSSDLAAAVNKCVTNGAKVINMSLGGPSSTTTEKNALQAAYDQGVLLIAAAGNDGNTAHSYPASYDSVVSVAAIDKNKVVADFSQQTNQVELAAPGVDIRSTYPAGTGLESQLSVGSVFFPSSPMTNGGTGDINATLASCGVADTTCASVNGKICVIERGSVSFAQKVESCQNGGGIAAIVYNNTTGDFGGTLGDAPTTTIPALAVTQDVGQQLMAKLGQTAHLVSGASNYGLMSGTSMATPHVSGVAALVWSHFPTCTNAQIRNALRVTAEDLGTAGRDNAYGYGLVRTKNAVDYLTANGCDGSGNGGGTTPPTSGDSLENGVAKTNLSGAAASEVTFTMTVPAGATNLKFDMSGGTGDADLYVKFGSEPTKASYDCRPYKGGNAESCTISNVQAGTYYVKLIGYSAYSGVSLVGSYTADSGNTGGGATGATNTVDNISIARRSWKYYTLEVPAGMSKLTVDIAGGSGDADLYVKFGSQPTSSSYDCRPYKSGNTENCTISAPKAGTYQIGIYGYAAVSGLSLTTSYQP